MGKMPNHRIARLHSRSGCDIHLELFITRVRRSLSFSCAFDVSIIRRSLARALLRISKLVLMLSTFFFSSRFCLSSLGRYLQIKSRERVKIQFYRAQLIPRLSEM